MSKHTRVGRIITNIQLANNERLSSMARKTKVTPAYIHHLKHGRAYPTLDFITGVLDKYDLSKNHNIEFALAMEEALTMPLKT